MERKRKRLALITLELTLLLPTTMSKEGVGGGTERERAVLLVSYALFIYDYYDLNHYIMMGCVISSSWGSEH
jgi:hypothetical protein